ncbi:hypothetical protein BGZ83_011552 [Gryganskiella cystojenkinii]|nr:hypothetical protein BGZ83_011552 [Gryganskiella cystojenkinii]
MVPPPPPPPPPQGYPQNASVASTSTEPEPGVNADGVYYITSEAQYRAFLQTHKRAIFEFSTKDPSRTRSTLTHHLDWLCSNHRSSPNSVKFARFENSTLPQFRQILADNRLNYESLPTFIAFYNGQEKARVNLEWEDLENCKSRISEMRTRLQSIVPEPGCTADGVFVIKTDAQYRAFLKNHPKVLFEFASTEPDRKNSPLWPHFSALCVKTYEQFNRVWFARIEDATLPHFQQIFIDNRLSNETLPVYIAFHNGQEKARAVLEWGDYVACQARMGQMAQRLKDA